MPVKSRPPGDRAFVVTCIALKKDFSNKDVGGRIGMASKEVSRRLRKKSLDDPAFEQLLAGVEAKPSEVAAATACFEAMAPDPDLTEEEQAVAETIILENARRDRAIFKEMALRSREAPPPDRYPEPEEVEPIRSKAREQMTRLKALTVRQRLGAVRFPEFHHWGFIVEAAAESERAASQDLDQATGWAQMASEVAGWVKGPEWWCNRLKGAVGAYGSNVLRVTGKIKGARAAFRPAEVLWNAGADPLQIFDPALLLDLDASLCRAERRFEVSLSRIAQALKIGRQRDRYLIKKAFTLEAMGDYERAVQALLEAEPSRQAEPRLWYQQRFNLCVLYTHLERFSEAASLIEDVREVAVALGDRIFLCRVTWLEGRFAAGLGRTPEALRLLEEARGEFAGRDMWFDVALALLEASGLLLDDGRTAEVRALTPTLAEAFNSNGIHREALAALQLFQEAVEQDTATAELARRVLRFLFRARCDQGLASATHEEHLGPPLGSAPQPSSASNRGAVAHRPSGSAMQPPSILGAHRPLGSAMQPSSGDDSAQTAASRFQKESKRVGWEMRGTARARAMRDLRIGQSPVRLRRRATMAPAVRIWASREGSVRNIPRFHQQRNRG